MTGTPQNSARIAIQEFGNIAFESDAIPSDVSAAATLCYVGSGRDVERVEITPGDITVEVFQLVNVAWRGIAGDGSIATNFPRLFSSANPQMAAIDPGLGRILSAFHRVTFPLNQDSTSRYA